VEVQKFGIPPIKWWLVGIHCVNVAINKLYIYFFSSWCGDLGPLFPQKTLIHTFCTHFSHQVTNISDKKSYTSFNIKYNISRNVEIVNSFQVAKFVKESIIFVEMQYLFVYHVLEYLFHLFSLFFKLWKSTFDFYCFALFYVVWKWFCVVVILKGVLDLGFI
jgi:hypothetical protein